MPTSADSFNATGPTIVGFETTSADVPVLQAFGTSVVGTTCGVYGQATAGPQKDRRNAPPGTGVLGSGDTQGVLGVGFPVTSDNTPDFSSLGPFGSFGVAGVSAGDGFPGSDAPAVFGDNSILSDELANFSHVQAAVQEGVRLPAGVEGISWAGFGVCGFSLNRNADKSAATDLSLGEFSLATNVISNIVDAIDDGFPVGDPFVTNTAPPSGVLGLSVHGAGVRGGSAFDRGGIFEAATADARVVAQIRLVPQRVQLGHDPLLPHSPLLPRDGQTGDLLAVVPPDANQRFFSAQLWFCERGRTGSEAAQWRRIAFEPDTVIGSV
jgi:hypothetical protein